MKVFYTLLEEDQEDKETSIVGVFDSVENANKGLTDYYGVFETVKHKDVHEFNLEWFKELKVKDHMNKYYNVKLWLQYFILNEV